MEEKVILRMQPQKALPLLSGAKNPEAALFYAYIYSNGGSAGMSELSALIKDPGNTRRICDNLVMYGIAAIGETPVPVSDPIIDPEELSKARKSDPAFTGLCNHYEEMLGRPIRLSEMQTLSDIVRELEMPCDTVVLLIHYLKEQNMLSPRNLQKTAYKWHDEGIHSYSEAEEHIAGLALSRSRERTVARILGIADRPLSETEKKIIGTWISRGCGDDVIREAYDKTVMRTGRLQLRYMDRILSSWDEKGITSASDVPLLDGRENIETIVSAEMEKKRKKREAVLASRLSELRKDPAFRENEKELRLCALGAARDSVKGGGTWEEKAGEKRADLLKARNDILARLGKPGDYLDLKPDCPLCGDLGFIGSRKCECFIKACEEKRTKKQEKS